MKARMDLWKHAAAVLAMAAMSVTAMGAMLPAAAAPACEYEIEAMTEAVTEAPIPAPDEDRLAGDVNDDGLVSLVDVVALQRWLLGAPSARAASFSDADLNGDGEVDIFDLALMKRAMRQ